VLTTFLSPKFSGPSVTSFPNTSFWLCMYRRTVILVERSGEGPLEVASTTVHYIMAETESLTPHSHSSPSSPWCTNSLRSIKDRDPNDVLIFPKSGTDDFVQSIEKGFDTMATLVINEEEFSVAHLAVLFNLAYKTSLVYNVFKRQCYWYSEAIYSVIKIKCPLAVETRHESFRNHGRLKGVAIKQDRDMSIEFFVKKFDAAWATFKEAVARERAEELADAEAVEQERQEKEREHQWLLRRKSMLQGLLSSRRKKR